MYRIRYRTGIREVSTIRSNEFLKNLYRHLDNQRNQGTCEWHDRKLVLVNQTETHPRPAQTVIPVPDTGPGEFTKIATDIDARGFEGNFDCKWEMQDADGENCFPNKRWDFNIRIQVTFHTSDEGDTRG